MISMVSVNKPEANSRIDGEPSVASPELAKVTPESPFSIDADSYDKLLRSKVVSTFGLLSNFMTTPLQDECRRLQSSLEIEMNENANTRFCVFRSPAKFFRLRIRLGVVISSENKLSYAIWEKGGLLPFPEKDINECYPIPAKIICDMMPRFLNEIDSEATLRNGLRACHFMTTLSEDEVMITLVYDRELIPSATNLGLVPVDVDEKNCTEYVYDSSWVRKALQVKEFLRRTWPNVKFNLIGRCKGTALVIGSNYIVENLSLRGTNLKYRQVEGAFSNPNGVVNCKALEWLYCCAEEITSKSTCTMSLLEMYCGNCNHTCALAPLFDNVVAVEINQKLCDAACFNLQLNNISNVRVIESDSGKVSKRIIKTYESQGKSEWEVLLVDPPRGGLDNSTLSVMKFFEHILYISCSPESLRKNLMESKICESHEIVKFAIFDQFAYTSHIESGVHLRRKI